MSRYTVSFGAKLTTSGPTLRSGRELGICPYICEEVECNRGQSHKCRDCEYPWMSAAAWKYECRNGDYVDAKCPQCKNFYYKKASDFNRSELDLEIVGEMMKTFGNMTAISFYKMVIQKQREFPSRRDISLTNWSGIVVSLEFAVALCTISKTVLTELRILFSRFNSVLLAKFSTSSLLIACARLRS